jgi:hypothetical protein
LANDEDQAKDNLTLIKKLIGISSVLETRITVKLKEIVRKDNGSVLAILPAQDIIGSHGKTYNFICFDEIHGYRTYDLFEALAFDPSRPDSIWWISSYNTIFNTPGVPLFDLIQQGIAGSDPKQYFSWYAADYCTDPALADASPEERANPSMGSWGNSRYLEQQKRRLPTNKYRRLHLNLAGLVEGAFYDAGKVQDCIIPGRRQLSPRDGIEYRSFVDMSGGSSDDATLAIAHRGDGGKIILDLVTAQTGPPPFNPRDAVKKFAGILRQYRCSAVTGDSYGGLTFQADFQEERISFNVSGATKHQLYEALEPLINAGEVELLDIPRLQEQLLGLTVRGKKIDYIPGEHDDWINSAAGAIGLVAEMAVGVGAVDWAMSSGGGDW